MADVGREKLFGRYHEVALLFIGFLLTTVIGGGLSFTYQSLGAENARRAEERRREIAQASSTFEELSRLMDRRLYRTRQYAAALENPASPEDLASRRADYRLAVSQWNESLNRNLARVEVSFGCANRNRLEGNIQEQFRAVHALLNAKPRNVANIEAKANALNVEIYMFDRAMLSSIKDEQVGSLRQDQERC